PEIRIEKNVHALVDVLSTDHWHPQLSAEAALSAVCRNHVLSAHVHFAAIAAIDDLRRDARGVLFACRNLGIEAKRTKNLRFCESSKRGHKFVWGAHTVGGGAQCSPRAAWASRPPPFDLLPSERSHPYDQARPFWGKTSLANCALDAALAE